MVNSAKKRLSVATFFSSNLDSELGPAPSLISPQNPAIFQRVPTEKYFKDFFARRLDGKSYLKFMKIDEDGGHTSWVNMQVWMQCAAIHCLNYIPYKGKLKWQLDSSITVRNTHARTNMESSTRVKTIFHAKARIGTGGLTTFPRSNWRIVFEQFQSPIWTIRKDMLFLLIWALDINKGLVKTSVWLKWCLFFWFFCWK